MDTVEDELDYGEYELGDQNFDPSFVQPSGPTSAFTEEEATQDEDYEGLYDDVNIGYFEPSTEISTKRKSNGERFEGSYEEEEAYADMKGRSVGSMYGIKQEALQSLPDFEYPGAEESLPSLTAGHQKEQQESGVFPDTQSKEKTMDELENKQSGIARLAEVPSTRCSEAANFDYVEDQKEASIRIKDKKHHEVACTPGCTNTRLRARNEGDSICDCSEQRALANMTFSPQERDVRGNGHVFVEALSGTSNMGNNEGNILADDISVGEATKVVGSFNARGRGARASVDGGRGSAGGGRLSQNGGNRESSSTAANDHLTRHGGQSHSRASEVNGGLMLFVGELHWWTTDAEIEAALSEFGSVKNMKFFEERASGKSKGYCQVEFYDHSAAAACKGKMNGQNFHGRPCVVAFANSRTIVQMGTAQVNKAQERLQAQQAQVQMRRMNDGGGCNRGGSFYQGGDNARGYGRMGVGGRGSHGQGVGGKGGYNGPVRGRGTVGMKRSSGNNGGVGGATYTQGIAGLIGSHPSGMVMPQGIMGQGYDPGYGPPMGRGAAGYGGYVLPGQPFPGMMPPFSNMGPGALTGVAPHVNPAFFSRTATSNGMGMMAGSGMDAPLAGLWGNASSNGWVSEEHDRRVREASYGDEMRGSNYGYSTEMGYEKGRPTGGRDKERDRVIDGGWSERRQRDDRDREREHHRERDGYRDQGEREWEQEKDDDWEREKLGRTRTRVRMVDEEEEQRSHARDELYGKKRRMGTEK